MRLIFHGVLKDLAGPEATMQANSIVEALEGFSRQVSNWPRDIVIAVPGFDTPALLTETENPPEEIHVMPRLAGGGGKFGSIILGGLEIAVGAALFFFVPGAQAIGISLMISGGMMMAMGVINLFMKAPSLKSSADPADSNYLGINQNTTAARTPILMAWGRVNLQPHWLSLASDSSKLSHGSFPVNPT